MSAGRMNPSLPGADRTSANRKIVREQMLRLLPIQILLTAVGAVNGFASSFFASNFVGVDAMTAVGLYSPVLMFLTSVISVLVIGSTMLCGLYMGKNEQENLQGVFTLDIAVSIVVGLIFTGLFLFMGWFDLTGFITRDAAIRPLFNRYLIGQAIGIVPLMLGGNLSSFLFMDNRSRRATAASLVYIAVNLLFNYIFVQVLGMQEFGLALAASLGSWVYMAVEAQYFLSGKSSFRISLRSVSLKELWPMVKIGFPGAAGNIYQTIRGMLVNNMITVVVGSVGVSAFGAANTLLSVFWSIPAAMLNVSRILISVSVGEEDRETLTNVMRNVFLLYIPIMAAVSAALIACAVPITRIYFRDPSNPVYAMTIWGIRILPLCMPLSIICTHFVCLGQTMDRQAFIHIESLLDGVVCVSLFSFLLIRPLGLNGVYIANVLNGVVTALFVVVYAAFKIRHFPRNIEELMALPEDFGASEQERLDLSVKCMDDVVNISEEIQIFCLERGIDDRRAHLAGLALEEMAGNVVDYGFEADRKKHTVDVRVVHREDEVLLCIKDDCVKFDPDEFVKMTGKGEDLTKNIGLRIVFRIAKEVKYQNVLGLNVLTMKI